MTSPSICPPATGCGAVLSAVLVINSGSSSLKFSLFDASGEKVLTQGLAEELGSPDARLRAGELVYGEGDMRSTWGWASPNYGRLAPALSVAVAAVGDLPLSFTSRWILPAG